MANKKENGVSLLALVVTIIVLIIIAGAVIANIRGNSGIINQSANADKKKLTSEEKEAVQWAAAQAVADETNKSGVIADKAKIQEKLNTYIGDADSKNFEYNIYGPGDTYINKILTADIYVVKFQKTGNAYIIDETGNVRLDEDSSGIVDRDGVLINPGSISINREPTGKYYELTITSNTKDYKVTCSDESVLDVKKDKNGKILVENNKIFVRGKELGKATILVETSKEKRAMSYVTVHQEPTSIELTASGHILDISSAIKSLQIKPTIYPSTANYKTGIKWTSSNNDIAVVDENGFVTGISNGDVTITATTENGKTATWNVTVISTPLSIGLDKENVTLDISTNKTYQFKATIYPSTANTDIGLTWSSSDNSVATVNKDGVVTGVKNGTTVIKVVTENQKATSASVTVQTSPVSISISPSSATIDLSAENKSVQLKATISPNTTNIKDKITWTSTNNNIATVDSNGLVRGYANGTVTITATTANGKSTKATITVQTSPTAIFLDKTNIVFDMSKNRTAYLTVRYNPSTANVNKGITWTSSNNGVVSVDGNGAVTAKGNGNATITAITTNGKTAQCKVQVITSITSISLNKTSATIEAVAGQSNTLQLIATVNPSTATENIQWTSSNWNVLHVSQSGLVTVQNTGSAVITVSNPNGTIKATCSISVNWAPITISLSGLSRSGEGSFGSWSYTVPPGVKYAIVKSYSQIYSAYRDRNIYWTYSGNGSKSWTHYLDGSWGNSPSRSTSERVELNGGSKWEISVSMSSGFGVGVGSANVSGYVDGSVTFYYK